jgi:ferredoxin--NADP+ reductase
MVDTLKPFDPGHLAMSPLNTETVLSVHHWNDTLFSFRTTRDRGLRFASGQFVMVGLDLDGRPLTRAYSIASASHDEYLEFFSIKVPDGPLTSRLQHLQPGDPIVVSRKPTGTLVLRDLRPGRRLLLLATGTGLAPFMSLVQEPETYERFERIILVHGVRRTEELAYRDFLEHGLKAHEYLGDLVRDKLVYYPTVTRERFRHEGRLTDLVASGKLFADLGEPPLSAADDRAMLCGNAEMLKDMTALLDARGFKAARHYTGELGDYVIERAFVEK